MKTFFSSSAGKDPANAQQTDALARRRRASQGSDIDRKTDAGAAPAQPVQPVQPVQRATLDGAQRQAAKKSAADDRVYEEMAKLQARLDGPVVAPFKARDSSRSQAGLPESLRAGVESLSGLSLDGIRVHYDSGQPAQLNALAFARGADIHLAPGQEQRLPHEAWHVVQQAQGRVRATSKGKNGAPLNDDKSLEREADEMGRRAAERAQQAQVVPPQRETGSRAAAPSLDSQSLPVQAMVREEESAETAPQKGPHAVIEKKYLKLKSDQLNERVCFPGLSGCAAIKIDVIEKLQNNTSHWVESYFFHSDGTEDSKSRADEIAEQLKYDKRNLSVNILICIVGHWNGLSIHRGVAKVITDKLDGKKIEYKISSFSIPTDKEQLDFEISGSNDSYLSQNASPASSEDPDPVRQELFKEYRKLVFRLFASKPKERDMLIDAYKKTKNNKDREKLYEELKEEEMRREARCVIS